MMWIIELVRSIINSNLLLPFSRICPSMLLELAPAIIKIIELLRMKKLTIRKVTSSRVELLLKKREETAFLESHLSVSLSDYKEGFIDTMNIIYNDESALLIGHLTE